MTPTNKGIEEAILLAVEGGYEPFKSFKLSIADKLEQTDFETIICWRAGKAHGSIKFPRVFLDPNFWQCLGKSLGWGFDYLVDPSSHYAQDEWEDKWHEFIAHIALGKSPDSFFEEFFNKN